MTRAEREFSDRLRHFKAWEELGLELGLMYDAALTVEGYQRSGFADVYKNSIVISDKKMDKKINRGKYHGYAGLEMAQRKRNREKRR